MIAVQDLSAINADSEAPIWLYANIGWIMQMIEEGGLPVDSVADYISEKKNAIADQDCFDSIDHRTNRDIRNITCIAEFYSSGGDLWSAWARYRPSKFALQTSVDRLSGGLHEDQFKLYIVPVTSYTRLNSVSFTGQNSTRSSIVASEFASQFSYKGASHDSEQAIRLIAVSASVVDGQGKIKLGKLRHTTLEDKEVAAADLDVLIDRIIVSPHAAGWIADLLDQYLCDDFGLTNKVNNSSLS